MYVYIVIVNVRVINKLKVTCIVIAKKHYFIIVVVYKCINVSISIYYVRFFFVFNICNM